MPEPAQSSAPKHAEDFATVMTRLARASDDPDEFDSSALADDVASFSYGQGACSQRPLPENESQSTNPGPHAFAVAARKERKTGSITIRLTLAEQAQLHARAAEAALSVSAYLRSCIFETESLRAQVKQALAQMQASPMTASTTAHANQPSRNWRERFLPRWSHRPRSRTEN
jgi:hypothetical protein